MTRATKKAAKSRRAKESAQVLELVPKKKVDDDTVEVLRNLLLNACQGKVTGLAFVAMAGPKKYVVDTAGIARDYPTFARGAVAILDDVLRQDILESEENSVID